MVLTKEEMEEFHDRAYMKDEEYIKLLEKIVEVVDAPDFKPDRFDDTTTGCKSTNSNCGLCNDGENSTFATIDNVLFPDQFPGRKHFKYFETYQQCPFDYRKNPTANGCFYTCYLFQNRRSSLSIETIRRLAHKRLDDKKKKVN
jgi:hypothetical protein